MTFWDIAALVLEYLLLTCVVMYPYVERDFELNNIMYGALLLGLTMLVAAAGSCDMFPQGTAGAGFPLLFGWRAWLERRVLPCGRHAGDRCEEGRCYG